MATPVLDAKELALMEKLVVEYEKFTAPGIISRSLSKTKDFLVKLAPKKALDLAKASVDAAVEADMVKKALEFASRGFGELTKQASRFTLTQKGVLEILRRDGHSVEHYEAICALRSYSIEKSLVKRNWKDFAAAFLEGAGTGALGFLGIPLNVALSLLLYFRATQSTALYYGYDVIDDPRELQFASEVTLTCLQPNVDEGVETVAGVIGKMMLAAEQSALSRALSKTYLEMANAGGGQLLYVQIRALANKAAETALKKAGQEGMEASVFRRMLEEVARRLPKEFTKKALPIIGAVIGGVSDSYFMTRVSSGANLIYHKRFLHEKETRLHLLKDGPARNS